jgi:ATP-dependent Lhr-like helicase
MLLTRRLERAGRGPLGSWRPTTRWPSGRCRDLGEMFVERRPSLAELFDEDMLGDDLEAWMADSYL